MENDDYFNELMRIYASSIHEGLNLSLACEEIKKMKGYFIFLGLSSEVLNNGTYDLFFQLFEAKLVDKVVTTPEFVIFDILKTLKKKNLNKKFFTSEEKEFLFDFFNKISIEFAEHEMKISNFIEIIGQKIGPDSILGQAIKNDIKIYVPTICDSLIGFYCKNIILDALGDVYDLNNTFFYEKCGAVILGTSNLKHSILNANLFRNGIDSCVIINTCNEFDCSDSGANVDEAISWGKIKGKSKSIKVKADPCIIFPILHYFWMKNHE